MYIKVWKLFKGGNYARAETIRGNTVYIFLFCGHKRERKLEPSVLCKYSLQITESMKGFNSGRSKNSLVDFCTPALLKALKSISFILKKENDQASSSVKVR